MNIEHGTYLCVCWFEGMVVRKVLANFTPEREFENEM